MDGVKQQTSRRCRSCDVLRPLEDFRRVRRGEASRRSNCNDCHKRREVGRQRAVRQKRIGCELQKRCTAIAGANDPKRLVQMAEGLLELCGGWDGLAKTWAATIKAAKSKKRYGRVYQMLRATWHLQLEADRLRLAYLNEMPDDKAFIEIVCRRPEAAALVLQRLGWTVQPTGIEEPPSIT
jgi:hypothetical protein